MPQYILRDLPPDVWGPFSARAEADGWPKRALILQLLADYAAGRIAPSAGPPVRLVPHSCEHCGAPLHLHVRVAEPRGKVVGGFHRWDCPVCHKATHAHVAGELVEVTVR